MKILKMMNFGCCLALCINSVHSHLTLRVTNRALMYSASDFLNFVFICWLSCERKPRQAKFDIWAKFDIHVKNYSYPWKLNSEPSPGRKTRQGIEINSKTTLKPLKIEKIMKSRKTRQNLRIHRFFDFKYAFSLCWRSKSFKMRSGDQPPRLMICFVSRKKENV